MYITEAEIMSQLRSKEHEHSMSRSDLGLEHQIKMLQITVARLTLALQAKEDIDAEMIIPAHWELNW